MIAAAWLHDILEDTGATSESLFNAGIPHEVIDALLVLTKSKGESYEEYLDMVSMNGIARQVKVADMLHNLSDKPTKRQIIKYSKGLLLLLDGGGDVTKGHSGFSGSVSNSLRSIDCAIEQLKSVAAGLREDPDDPESDA